MTKTVIEMAREAGFPFNKYGLLAADENGEIDADEMFERFAAIIREDKREKQQAPAAQEAVAWASILDNPYMCHPKMSEAELAFADGWNALRKRLLEIKPTDWMQRALEAEALNDRFIAELNSENGPTFMGEPVIHTTPPSSADSPEVKALEYILQAAEWAVEIIKESWGDEQIERGGDAACNVLIDAIAKFKEKQL